MIRFVEKEMVIVQFLCFQQALVTAMGASVFQRKELRVLQKHMMGKLHQIIFRSATRRRQYLEKIDLHKKEIASIELLF